MPLGAEPGLLCCGCRRGSQARSHVITPSFFVVYRVKRTGPHLIIVFDAVSFVCQPVSRLHKPTEGAIYLLSFWSDFTIGQPDSAMFSPWHRLPIDRAGETGHVPLDLVSAFDRHSLGTKRV